MLEAAINNMVHIVIYGTEQNDVERLEAFLRQALQQRKVWTKIETFVGNLPRYLQYVKKNPYLIMVAALPGASGPRVAREIRENNRKAKMVWLSTDENILASYSVHATSFGLLPVTRQGVEQFLAACGLPHL